MNSASALLLLLIALLLSSACSLVQQDLPNEDPVLQASRIDTLKVRRGGRIALSIQAADEDDDPLFYYWTAFGVGTFTDSTRASTDWIAPLQIQGNSEKFVLTVHIRDRDCLAVSDLENRSLCEEEARQTVETFLVEVVQSPPVLTVTTVDTAISFREPRIELTASATDEDGDALEFKWTQTAGDTLDIERDPVEEGIARIRFTPLIPDDYRFAVQVSDGSDTLVAEIDVRVFVDPEPPTGRGNMVTLSLTLTDGSTRHYEIDVYEYPNEKGTIPFLATNWFEAATICEAEGKRLCSKSEWVNACRGGEDAEPSTYSSADDPDSGLLPRSFGLRFCNVAGSAIAGDSPQDPASLLALAGTFPNCSTAGVYDLTGNALEWVESTNIFGQRVGDIELSSVQEHQPCGTFSPEPFEPLPDGLDITSREAIQALPASYSSYAEFLRGFRCCR